MFMCRSCVLHNYISFTSTVHVLTLKCLLHVPTHALRLDGLNPSLLFDMPHLCSLCCVMNTPLFKNGGHTLVLPPQKPSFVGLFITPDCTTASNSDVSSTDWCFLIHY